MKLANLASRSHRTVEKWELGTAPIPRLAERCLEMYEVTKGGMDDGETN